MSRPLSPMSLCKTLEAELLVKTVNRLDEILLRVERIETDLLARLPKPVKPVAVSKSPHAG